MVLEMHSYPTFIIILNCLSHSETAAIWNPIDKVLKIFIPVITASRRCGYESGKHFSRITLGYQPPFGF